jgi:DNA topoisomerase IA
MKVILTEKPSVARDIEITWGFGYLVELKEPDEYHEARRVCTPS